ncbi:hypothetical protein [Pyrodictium abyssi]|uniref:Uncharacterized protein n=1 Tax=Pyrodictium abyssi TaxID=54256 RepID=A0ABN6ZSS8_9CREN|nr:hypothetical protein PABY_12670 [Pyrodictium abyssi]
MPLIRVDELLDANSRSKARSAGILLSAQLVNYTPVMLGDYDTYHFRERPDGKYEPVAGLYAQAIRGKARWLARVVLASLHGCDFNSYYEVETQCARVLLNLGDSKRKEKVNAGLIELLFGTLSSTQLSSPFVLSVKVERLGAMGWKSGKRYALNRYEKLLVMGSGPSRREKEEKLKPHEPGSVVLRLEIREAPYASRLLGVAKLGDRPLRELYWRLAAFYAGIVITVPFLLGLGKASTRGFGRFMVATHHIHNGLRSKSRLKELIDNINSLYSAKSSREATRLLHELIDKLIILAEEATGIQRGKPSIGMIPRLINAIKPPSEIHHVRATVVETRASDPLDALEFIAAAVLKHTWKRHQRISGVNYHTWPLGLPRGSDIPCTCASSIHNESRHGSRPRQRYGYIVLDVATESMYELGENNCMANSECMKKSSESVQEIDEQAGVDTLVEARIDLVVRVNDSVVTRRSNVKAKDVRHISMIHLFPLPNAMDGVQGTLVAVLPFMSFSLNLGLDSEAPHIEGYKLFHVGGHFVVEDGKPRPCCNAHVIDVGYIMNNTNVSSPSTDSWNLNCGCGSDPGGIVWPDDSRQGGYLDALVAAYEWVINCLQRLRVTRGGLRLY